jgi:hypothetical protein
MKKSRLGLLSIGIALVILVSVAHKSHFFDQLISGVPRSAWAIAAIQLGDVIDPIFSDIHIPIFT